MNRLSVLHHGLGITPDLDAHTRNLFETYKTGVYINATPIYGGSTVAIVANTLYAMPFPVARAMTIDRLGIQVTTGSAGNSARLGIYEQGTNFYPGSLLLDAGEVSVADITLVAATISQSLAKGFYWLALVSNGTPTLLWIQPTISLFGTHPGATQQPYAHYTVAHTYGSLPDPFTAGASVIHNNAPNVLFRVASLD